MALPLVRLHTDCAVIYRFASVDGLFATVSKTEIASNMTV